MQVTETANSGLKRELKVVIGASEINDKFSAKLSDFKDHVQLKGFRKGKAPLAHLKKIYGRSIMGEVLDEVVRDTTNKAVADRNERPVQHPHIEFPKDPGEIDKVFSGEADLAYTVSFEVLPKFEIADLKSLKLERLTADIDDAAVEKALSGLAERATTFEPAPDRAAEQGDRVTASYLGKIDGVPFEGGASEDATVVIGSNSYIPGLEAGFVGIKAGEERSIPVSFPEDYPAEHLKGKAAVFEVKAKEVAAAKTQAINDDLARFFGLESLDALKARVREQIKQADDMTARQKLKRQLLDQLDKAHTFELPPTLVDGEFQNIWAEVTGALERAGKTFKDEDKTEEGAREEYRKIAERRVRLGLVLGEIGERNKIEVSEDELKQAMLEEVRRFPGQERMVFEYFKENPGAVARLRAPILENKVVDFVCELAKPAERKVDRATLLKPDDDEA